MSDPTKEQIEKLPQWAQQYITRLERKREKTRELIEEVAKGGDSEFSYRDLRADNKPLDAPWIRLPKYANLCAFEGAGRLDINVSKPGRIQIRSGLGYVIFARPVASNVIEVWGEQ